MSNKLPDYITFQQLEELKTSSVWVKNATASMGIEKQGIINITVITSQGNTNNVTIPITIAPVDLSLQSTKSSLINSPELRSMVARGFIKLLSPDYANKLLEDPAVRRAYERVINAAGQSQAEFEQTARENGAEVHQSVSKAEAESTGNISGFVLNLVNSVDSPESDLLISLESRLEALNVHDLKYIAMNSKVESIKNLATTRLLDINSAT